MYRVAGTGLADVQAQFLLLSGTALEGLVLTDRGGGELRSVQTDNSETRVKDFKWYEWAMLVVLILIAIGGALMSPWGQAIIASEAAPAWIQAVGSVGAIGVAIGISRSQYNQDRIRERKRTRDSLGAALVLAERSRDLVNECLITDSYTYFDADKFLHDPREFEQVAVALRGVPVHEFPPRVVLAVMSAAQCATQAKLAVEAVGKERGIDIDLQEHTALDWLASLRDRLDKAVEDIRNEHHCAGWD